MVEGGPEAELGWVGNGQMDVQRGGWVDEWMEGEPKKVGLWF